ncbi:hypothetical protein ACFQZW_12205 [Lutibacter aestuarii]|uniref:Uncharacterized protein n=1 Tax=Lutibacter aestuarii TaxID=861111 RepID=A0ABW2Z7X1_9FLAO
MKRVIPDKGLYECSLPTTDTRQTLIIAVTYTDEKGGGESGLWNFTIST